MSIIENSNCDFSNTSSPFYSQFIHLSRYSRWLDSKKRRENWGETVQRYLDFWKARLPDHATEIQDLYSSIYSLDVMPSMRCLMTAGKALERDEVAGYNCAYMAIDNPRAFDEMMYILMCGTGVGFSVERQFISKLPDVAEEFHDSETVITVRDSKIGWATAFRELISLLYAGQIPKWDVSSLRPAGAKLKTMGGRSSGPEPLVKLFKFCVNLFRKAAGRKLSSLECHDLACMIGDIVVVGGVRRCYPGHAKVQTPSGIVNMSDTYIGQEIITGGRISKITGKIDSGKQKTIVVHHEYGKTELTPNHRIAVFNKANDYCFKEAKNLIFGDRLVWDLCGYEGTNQSIPPDLQENHFNSKQYRIPQEINENVSWLIGLIHGDGYIGERTIEISGNVEEWQTLERAAKIFQDNFGITGDVHHDSHGGNGIRLRINSAGLARWFLENIKKPNEAIRIPEFISKSQKNIRFSYLAGILDSDGRARKDGVVEVATSVYPSYIEDLYWMLQGLGITCTIFNGSKTAKKRRDKGESAQDYQSLLIRGNSSRKLFHAGIKNISLKIENFLSNYSSPYDFTYPEEWNLAYKNRSTTRQTAINRGLISENYPYAPSAVISIEDGEEQQTWDIEVKELGEFTADGLVTHNSALISLSNLSDDRMRLAKSGQWWNEHPHRALANNSVAYSEKPDFEIFLNEWLSLYSSKSGERGIFSRPAAKKQVAKYGRRDPNHEFGCNPCSEIFLRSNQFCNLSEIIVRPNDTMETLLKKAEVATILGTIQSTLTNFRYLRKIWQKNTEEERLLGVSMTGIMDCDLLNDPNGPELPERLEQLRLKCVETNKIWAKKLGIPESTAITCVKPSGCRPADALVASNEGIFELSEFDYSGGQWTEVDNNISGEYGRVTKAFSNGEAPIVNIDMSFGMQLQSTPNHKWMVSKRGWVRADELKEGDQIVLNLNSYTNTKNYKLKPLKILNFHANANTEIKWPTEINSDFAWLLGYIWGDGAMCEDKSRFRFTDGNIDAITKAQSLFKTLFDLDAKIRKLEDRNAWCMEVASRALWSGFEQNELIKPKTENITKIPLAIRKSSVESICAFLSGLVDSDGCVSNTGNGHRLIITTSQEKFARHIQQVALSVGQVLSLSILNKREGAYLNAGPMYHLSHSWGQSTEHKNMFNKHSVKMNGKENPESNSRSSIYKLGLIKSVSPGGVVPTFDVETEQHWFWAGAFMSHNTVSQLVDASSGIHPRFDKFYIRRVRIDKKDPLGEFLRMHDFPHEEDKFNSSVWVFEFPMAAPKNTRAASTVQAMEQLNLWKIFQDNWCEHKPSITVYYRDHEFLEIGNWIWNNFDNVSGIAFLPYSDHVYVQAPYESISQEKYEDLLKKMPKDVNWENLALYEVEDSTSGTQSLACSAGQCEVVDLVK